MVCMCVRYLCAATEAAAEYIPYSYIPGHQPLPFVSIDTLSNYIKYALASALLLLALHHQHHLLHHIIRQTSLRYFSFRFISSTECLYVCVFASQVYILSLFGSDVVHNDDDDVVDEMNEFHCEKRYSWKIIKKSIFSFCYHIARPLISLCTYIMLSIL